MSAAEEPPTFLPRLARILANEVEIELEDRGIIAIRSDLVGRKPEREVDRHCFDGQNLYQVTIIERWPNSPAQMPADQFLERHLRYWATTLAIKLARRAVLTTYPLDLPRGITACLGESDNLVLRVVVDYSMFDDAQVIRIDALASWSDA